MACIDNDRLGFGPDRIETSFLDLERDPTLFLDALRIQALESQDFFFPSLGAGDGRLPAPCRYPAATSEARRPLPGRAGRSAAMRSRARFPAPALMIVVALAAFACQQAPPVVNVQAPPCECACDFKATAPQVGKGCWVNGDLLVCPLVRRDLEIEPAYPAEDPRCERLENGDLQCEIHPGDALPPGGPSLPMSDPEFDD